MPAPHKYTLEEMVYVRKARSEGVFWKTIAHKLGVSERALLEATNRHFGALPKAPKDRERPKQVVINITEEVHTAVALRSMRYGKTMSSIINNILEDFFLSQPQ